ncbi:MAG: tetratricopeptide repeat protein [Edaphobacter sp.]
MAALLLSVACAAQTAPTQSPPAAPCPTPNQTATQTPDQTTKPCPPAAKKSTAEQFPFPGQTAKPATPPDSPTPGATTPSDAAAQHPFPTQPPPKLPGDDSSSSSSSSSSSNDDSDPTHPDDQAFKGDNPPEGTSVHRKLPKPKHIQSDDERVDEDLSVAKFYMRDENYQGAYLRAKDAVQIQPEYSDTHFALAQIAEKMKKKDEAIAEYQTYLKLDPNGEKAKDAKKSLAELNK